MAGTITSRHTRQTSRSPATPRARSSPTNITGGSTRLPPRTPRKCWSGSESRARAMACGAGAHAVQCRRPVHSAKLAHRQPPCARDAGLFQGRAAAIADGHRAVVRRRADDRSRRVSRQRRSVSVPTEEYQWRTLAECARRGCEGIELVAASRRVSAAVRSRSAWTGISLGTHLSSYGGAVAEIEVNIDTGRVVAKRMFGAIDPGQVINPGIINIRSRRK